MFTPISDDATEIGPTRRGHCQVKDRRAVLGRKANLVPPFSTHTRRLSPVSERSVPEESMVNCFDSSLRKQVFYVSKAQGEPMVQPDSVTDDFRWKAMPSIK